MVTPTTGTGGGRTARPLRFGAVAPITDGVPAWRDQLRRLADVGVSTVLMPDVPEWQPAPGPTLAMAAAVSGLRVGTWVYAAPVRPAWLTAWEAHSLSVVTEGRFELGIGTGRPGIADQLRALGLPEVPAGRRPQVVRDVIAALRDLDGPDLHTPVAMAVGGPRAQATAAELADVVNFVMPQTELRSVTAERVRSFDNRRDLELALHVAVVGDTVAPFMAGPDVDTAAVRDADSLSYLPPDPAAAVEAVLRTREELGFSYVVLGADAALRLGSAIRELVGT